MGARKELRKLVNIAVQLRKLRLAQGLTMKDVAQAIGVPASTYRDWEYGKAIKGEPYGKLAEFYGVRVDELLGGKMTELSEILVPLLEAREKIEEALKIARSLK